ncbi:MAG: hypothetical protein WC242_03750 [Candidatus Paceibacterota bacterium]
MEKQEPVVVVEDVVGIRQIGNTGASQHVDILGADGVNCACWSPVASISWKIDEGHKTVGAEIVTTDYGDHVSSCGTIKGPRAKIERLLEKLGYATLLKEEVEVR